MYSPPSNAGYPSTDARTGHTSASTANGLGDLGKFPQRTYTFADMVAAGSEHGTTTTCTVVVVDGRAVVRNGLVTALRAIGFEAVGAPTMDALDLRTDPPMAIVIDGARATMPSDALFQQVVAEAPNTRVLVVVDAINRPAARIGPELIERSRGADGIAMELNDPTGRATEADRTGARPVTSLSDAERSVLRFIAQGATARETAAGLGISPRTVEHHKRRIFDRLGAVTQAQAVSLAIRSGELSPFEIAS